MTTEDPKNLTGNALAAKAGVILVAHANTQRSERLVAALSTELPFEFVEVRDGVAAIREIRRLRPALLIADVDLPRLDGFQLCRLLPLDSEAGAAQTPVILTTNVYIDVVAEQVARDVGAFAYVHFTNDASALVRTVQLALGELQPAEVEPYLMRNRGHIAIAANDSRTNDNIRAALEPRGWGLHFEREAARIHALLGGGGIQCLMIEDSLLQPGQGLSVAQLRNDYPMLSLIILCEQPAQDAVVRLMESGADNVIIKPIDEAAARLACRHGKVKYNLRSVHAQLQEKIDKLRSVSDYLDMVIDHSQEAIFSCDTEGAVKIWNKGAEKMYGFSAEEIVGRNVDDFLNPPEFKRRAADVIKILGQRGFFTEPEVTRRKRNGDIFPVTATYSSLHNSQGRFIGFSVIERDVTPVKALEAERIKSARLRAITQTAVTANDHINTPLGVILGYSQFLKMKLAELSETDAAALDTIQEQVHKIKSIMNKLKLMSDPIVKNYSIEGVTMFDLTKSK